MALTKNPSFASTVRTRQITKKFSILSKSSSYTRSRNPIIQEDVKFNAFPVKIFDEKGNDVTPLPFTKNVYTSDKKSSYEVSNTVDNQTNDSSSERKLSNVKNTSSSNSDKSVKRRGSQLETPKRLVPNKDVIDEISQLQGESTFHAGPFSRTIFNVSTSTRSLDSLSEEEIIEPVSVQRHKSFDTTVKLDDSDLKKMTSIVLNETETHHIFEQKSMKVSEKHTKLATKINLENDVYEKKKEDNVNNNILYDHEMQTFNNVDKYKGVQTQDVKKEHKQNYATLCDLQESDHLLSADNTLMEIMSSSKDTKIKSASSKSAISTASTEIENVENNYINILEISEKIIAINNYKVNLAKYQDIKPPSTAGISGIFDIDYSDQDEMFHLEELWRLESDETNKNVTSINLNPKNEFILAITHGNYDKFRTEDYGLVSCWSLKNIEHPKRMHQFSTGVISCDFSKKNPNILAIGLHDGRIILFDVTLDENPVVLDNMNNPDKNIGIIWKLCWVIIEEKNDVIKLENLYSASQDGRITYWDKEKRFEANDIMLMKRAPIRKTNQKLTNSEIGKSELENQFLTGYTGAISMDFNKDNNKLYLVGTEDGSVQLCSISHNEQYLQTYYYHTAPINKIVWSPFNSDIFITASSDWTICIWSKHNDEPIVCLHGTKPVLDVIWSPSTSTLIASITSETLNIWDMTENLLDPITTNNAPPNSKYTCIKFNHDGKSIYVGTSVGVVYLYSLVGLSDKSLNNNSKQLKAILESKKIN